MCEMATGFLSSALAFRTGVAAMEGDSVSGQIHAAKKHAIRPGRGVHVARLPRLVKGFLAATGVSLRFPPFKTRVKLTSLQALPATRCG